MYVFFELARKLNLSFDQIQQDWFYSTNQQPSYEDWERRNRHRWEDEEKPEKEIKENEDEELNPS